MQGGESPLHIGNGMWLAAVGGAGGRDSVVDHRFELGCTGSFISGGIVAPGSVDVQLTADELGQILIGEGRELVDDIGRLCGSATML